MPTRRTTRSGATFGAAEETKNTTPKKTAATPPSKKKAAYSPESKAERDSRTYRLFSDHERANAPSSPTVIFKSDEEYYGQPNSSLRNWNTSTWHNHVGKGRTIKPYYEYLKSKKIPISSVTEARYLAEIGQESRSPAQEEKDVGFAAREDVVEDDDDSLAAALAASTIHDDDDVPPLLPNERGLSMLSPESMKFAHGNNGSYMDLREDIRGQANTHSLFEQYDGSSKDRALPIYIDKRNPSAGTSGILAAYNPGIVHDGRTVPGYQMTYRGFPFTAKYCELMVPGRVPYEFHVFKDSALLFKVPQLDELLKITITEALQNSKTQHEDSHADKTLRAYLLKMEKDERLKHKWYLLLFPFNEPLDNRILSHSDKEGIYLDKEYIASGHRSEEFKIPIYQGVSKFRIALASGASTFEDKRTTTYTGSFADLAL